MPDPIFKMSVDQLLDEAAALISIARKSKGRKRRDAACRAETVLALIRSYLVLGIPEPQIGA